MRNYLEGDFLYVDSTNFFVHTSSGVFFLRGKSFRGQFWWQSGDSLEVNLVGDFFEGHREGNFRGTRYLSSLEGDSFELIFLCWRAQV